MTMDDFLAPAADGLALAEGVFAADIANAADPAWVVIPAFSTEHREGPCPWMPRGAVLPQAGDPCLVAVMPAPWVVAWHPAP